MPIPLDGPAGAACIPMHGATGQDRTQGVPPQQGAFAQGCWKDRDVQNRIFDKIEFDMVVMPGLPQFGASEQKFDKRLFAGFQPGQFGADFGQIIGGIGTDQAFGLRERRRRRGKGKRRGGGHGVFRSGSVR